MNDQVFQQDLSEEENAGAIFVVKLLFKEPAAIPEKSRFEEVMAKRVCAVECFWHDEKGAGVAAKDYICHYEDGDIPPQLMITASTDFDGSEYDDFERSQMWDCMEDRDRILSECKHQVIGVDMMAAALDAQERAKLDMDFAEALAELYPYCEAMVFGNSGKMFLADEIRNHNIPEKDRFIKFAVNVRFFNVQDSEDMVIDTLGMGTLYLPDIQYHFHGFDPNIIVNHAYCTASYILDNNNPIEAGDPIDAATENGSFSRQLQWTCNYENSLIQPSRPVIDICTGKYASGNRG